MMENIEHNITTNYFGGIIMKKTIVLGIAVLASLSLAACESSSAAEAETPSQSTEAHTSNDNQKVTSKKESKTNDNTHPLDYLSPEKLASYNKGLADSLIEDQKFAKGGNNNYSWSTYIDSVSYSSRGLIANVNPNFVNLNNTDKTKIGKSLQGLAGAQIVMMNIELAPDAPSVYTNIHYNGHRIGHSKILNPSSFKWSK